MKEMTEKLDFIKIKKKLSSKDNAKRMRRQATWKTYLEKSHVIQKCYPKYTKNFLSSTIIKETI